MLFKKMQTIVYKMNIVIHELYFDTTQKHIATCVNHVTTWCKNW
jgi:hypothetical protein